MQACQIKLGFMQLRAPILKKMHHSPRRALWLSGCVVLFSMVAANVHGQNAIAWEELSREEQQLLRQVERRWEQLSADRKEELRDGAKRWLEMDAEERDRVRRQQDTFQRRSNQERERIVRRFQQFSDAPPAQQRRLKEVQERFQRLSPDDREALRLRFERQQLQDRENEKDTDALEPKGSEAEASAADSAVQQQTLPIRPEPPRFERPRRQGDGGHRPGPPRQR